MRLIKGGLCSAASVAMLLNEEYNSIYKLFQYEDKYPFPSPNDKLERVPSMEELCCIIWKKYKVGFMPFPKSLYCYPAPDSEPYFVWDGDDNFRSFLDFGEGLLEGVSTNCGHLCAWDGKEIYDPRGDVYKYEHASLFDFESTRFWLKI